MRSPGKYRIRDAIAEQHPASFSLLIFFRLVVYLPPEIIPADLCPN